MTTLEKWQIYWKDKTVPIHRSNHDEYYRRYAQELKILFGDGAISRVLEIGCGNGALYKFLGFEHAKYKGIDLSPSMLAEFKTKHPDAELECCDGSSYFEENIYDLIFSNGVIQYFDGEMLNKYFANVRSMMHQKSRFVCASIPWRKLRFHYHTGELMNTQKKSVLKGCAVHVKRMIFSDPMGYWYDLQDLELLGKKHGFKVEFYGAMIYLYRFHTIMTLY